MVLVSLVNTDISTVRVDAIVNAANSQLSGGGGVDGAIRKKAGLGLWEECRLIGHCDTGSAVITGGHRLLAKHVIHTVGPIYGHTMGQDAILLRKCYISCLKIADLHQLKSIAFPSISTGAYHYPIQEACDIATRTVNSYCSTSKSRIQHILFTTYNTEQFNMYREYMKKNISNLYLDINKNAQK